MSVHKYLDVSTSNITYPDSMRLREIGQPMVIHEHPYGFWVNVQHWDNSTELVRAMERILARGYSAGFIAMYELAHREGCNWINIDRDGEPEPRLEQFNW